MKKRVTVLMAAVLLCAFTPICLVCSGKRRAPADGSPAFIPGIGLVCMHTSEPNADTESRIFLHMQPDGKTFCTADHFYRPYGEATLRSRCFSVRES